MHDRKLDEAIFFDEEEFDPRPGTPLTVKQLVAIQSVMGDYPTPYTAKEIREHPVLGPLYFPTEKTYG